MKQSSEKQESAVNSNFEWEEIKTTASALYPTNRNCHTAVLYAKYMIVFGGKEGEGKKKFVNDVHVLDLETYIWLNNLKINGNAPEPRMGHSSQLFENDKVAVYGGWNGFQVLGDLFFLVISHENNPISLEWIPIKMEGIAPKRQFHTSCILGNSMYIFGGGDGKLWLNDLYVLNFGIKLNIKNINIFLIKEDMRWKLIEVKGKVPSGRLQHSSCIHNKKIFVFGGEPDRLRQLNDLNVFDIETNTWTELAPLGMPPSPRVSASSVVVGNKIYFFGGYDGTTWRNDTFTYNIDDNLWEIVYTSNNPPKQRCRHTAILYRNNIVIFGGNDSEKSYNDVHALRMNIPIYIEESSLVSDLRIMFYSKEFTDVTFIVENEHIPAHKSILACRCEQFKCMFSGQHLESQTNQITISDSRPNVFKAMLEYIYTDSTTINDNIAADLLILANKYLLQRLKGTCEEYLARQLRVKNIVEMINLAEKHEANYLKDYALKYMLQNKNIICETQDISNLSKEVLVELFKLKK